MLPWGVAEARELGIYDRLLARCAHQTRLLTMPDSNRDLVETTPARAGCSISIIRRCSSACSIWRGIRRGAAASGGGARCRSRRSADGHDPRRWNNAATDMPAGRGSRWAQLPRACAGGFTCRARSGLGHRRRHAVPRPACAGRCSADGGQPDRPGTVHRLSDRRRQVPRLCRVFGRGASGTQRRARRGTLRRYVGRDRRRARLVSRR